MDKQLKPPQTQSVARSALFFGSGTLTSRILGLIRDALLFSFMPLDMRDAWLAAFRLPNLFRRLLGEGGLSMSFIPVYVASLRNGEAKQTQSLMDGVFTLLMTVVILICLTSFLFMEPLVKTWLSGAGFSGVPGKIEMTIAMAKVMIFFFLFITLFAFFMALLNGRKKFTLTGFAPMLLNVSIIGSLWLFKDSGQLPQAAAWGVLIGGAFQALLLVPSVKKTGGLPKLTQHLKTPEVQKVLRRFVPTLLGMGVLQILNVVNVYFASQLQPGAVSYIFLADRLLELPLSLIAVSIGTTLLPTLSAFWADGDQKSFVGCVGQNVSLFFFLALPAATGLWFIGPEIVDVLFARGEFSVIEVSVVGGILKVYCLTLLSAGALKIFNQSFYAMGDTLTPAVVATVGLVFHLLLAPQLMALYQINGLVLSTALITLFNLLFCLMLLQKKVMGLNWVNMTKHFTLCLVACGTMGLYLHLMSQLPWQQGRFVFDLPILLTIIGGGAVIYFVTCSILRIPQLNFLKRRFKRSESIST